MIEIAITCSVFAFLLFLSFVTGLHYGSKLKNNEIIDLPKFNPIESYKNKKEEKEIKLKQEQEQAIIEAELANIDAYDGTAVGQKDIPNIN